jgi:NAD(P)-dependent dehydrogenase (short-subunit alcohol dehydrogenase family)
MELQNKVCVIAGGARVGAEVAQELARRGGDVILTYNSSRAAATETASAIRQTGRRCEIVKVNATHLRDVKNLAQHARRTFGRVDVLVNMVSVYRPIPFDKLTSESFDADIAAHARSAFLLVSELHSLMRGGGRIVHFADWTTASGRPRYKDYAAYYTAKASVLALTQAQALELAPSILVNCIAPGPILPPPNLTKREIREVELATPLHRWGGAREIAKTVIFLVESDFVTGECVRVDGGRHLV